jgi:hypothetical protein
MLYFQEPDIEPNYRINGVDLYTTDQTIQHAVKMQEFQLEMLRKQKIVTEASQKEWQGFSEQEIGLWRDSAHGILRWAEMVLREKNT